MREIRSIVTLTSSESKRLIARGIVRLPEVRNAYSEGYIGLPLCTSNAYVYEELSGRTIEDKSSYSCGYIFDKGFCSTNKSSLHPEVIFVKGKEEHINFPERNLADYIEKMTCSDVIIKSGNILDVNKKAGVVVGERNGGEFGLILPYVLARGINLIVPMTLNKTAPVVIDSIIQEAGVDKISARMTHGLCGMLPLPGRVITEIEALHLLAGVNVVPAAMGGVGTGEGCVTLLIKGDKEKVSAAWEAVSSIKGEPPLKRIPRCIKCSAAEKGACVLLNKAD